MSKAICVCCDNLCGEQFGSDARGNCARYCKFSKTAEKREEMKKENEEIKKVAA